MPDIKTKLYQMFILGMYGGNYQEALKKGLGGIIFFTNNILSKNQFSGLIKNIRSESVIPPFLSIDQEGGRVERTENIHGGKKYLSAKFACENGDEFLKLQTQKMAMELLEYGINLNFAPCIDTNTNPDNPIIGERAYSSNPDEVIRCAKIVADIYKIFGIIPCFKHFPGHGDANADSHLTLPEINLTLEQMEQIHIKPFKYAILDGAQMIMAAHLRCKCFELEKIPTSLSKNALDYLRNNLNFNGVIVSDDMLMNGVADFKMIDACIKGIKAGINLFIYRNSTSDIIEMIESIAEISANDRLLQDKIEYSFDKIMSLKKLFSII